MIDFPVFGSTIPRFEEISKFLSTRSSEKKKARENLSDGLLITPMEDAALLQSDPIASQRRFHSPNPRAKRD